MGSPIDTWEGAGAYFTGAGTVMPVLILLIAVVVCFGAIYLGARQEEAAHKEHHE